ncbi:MAG: class I SAM-dependent methyltransferase [Peptococcaceae bacterium]
MGNDIKLFYDLTAEKTAQEWYKEEILKPTIQDFISLLPEKPRVLDLGCGPGHESMRLCQAGAKVLGIDFSEECVRIANERCPQCEFKVMDFRYLDESLGKFDGVFACASLIHISPEELHGVINHICNVLRSNGYVAVIVVDGEGINEQWSLLEVAGRKLNRTLYMYKKEKLIEEVQKVGLQFSKEGYLDPKLLEFGWKNYIFKLE